MNLEYTDNGNTPPGFEDPGIKVNSGGTRKKRDEDKDFHWSMRDWPGTPQEADAQMNIIRQNPKSYDFENTRGNNEGA